MSNQVPLRIFPFTGTFNLPIAYKCWSVFALLWVELSFRTKFLSLSTAAWIKSISLGSRVGTYPVPGKMMLRAMSRWTSQVNLAVFPHLIMVALAIGMFFAAWFFICEVTSTKYMWEEHLQRTPHLLGGLTCYGCWSPFPAGSVLPAPQRWMCEQKLVLLFLARFCCIVFLLVCV